MTKKRFVKLLMSQGKQRNDAQKSANYYSKHNIPYKRAYKWFLLGSAFRNLGEAAKKCCASLGALSCSFNELREGMLQDD